MPLNPLRLQVHKKFLILFRAIFLGTLVLGGLFSAAHAGAWVQPRGALYSKLSFLAQRSGTRLNSDGKEVEADPSGGDYVEGQLFGYFEWGLTNRVTLLGSWAYKDMTVEAEEEFGTRSTGDLRLGVRHGLIQGPKSLAVETQISIPTYPSSDLDRPPAERSQALPAGTGEFEVELRVLGGLSFYPLPLYGNLDLGYRARGGGFADQWVGAMELGGSSPAVFAKFELRGLLENADLGSDLQVGNVAVAERSLRLGTEGAFHLVGFFWIDLGYTHLLTGRNTLTGDQWSLSLVYWGNGK